MLLARIKLEFTSDTNLSSEDEENLFDSISDLEDEFRDLAQQLAQQYPGVNVKLAD